MDDGIDDVALGAPGIPGMSGIWSDFGGAGRVETASGNAAP
jgi:hypothetical protein